jgi:hypothetical protein
VTIRCEPRSMNWWVMGVLIVVLMVCSGGGE